MSTTIQLRAALYARYSTDRQRETSIDDQLRAAHALAEREGWQVVAQHADESISGSTPVALRPGGKALLADALAGRYQVLILEGLDRLSREIGEAETITKRLEHRGIRIVGTADGYDSHGRGRKVMRIARGLVNELYLDDLREKTHRGLAGQFERGYHVGGVCFGYRSEPTSDGRGRRLVINDVQAEVVRRIFTWYSEGVSARTIAHRLNSEGTAAPRGGTWAVSALIGDRSRGAGLLNSEIYIGRLVWNRRQWLKDPDTGRRRYVDRPRHEWQVRDVPDLRIVPDELWQAVRARDRSVPGRGPRGGVVRTLLGGVLRCACCGGPMVAIDARRYGCNVNRDRGQVVCSAKSGYNRKRVEDAVLAIVRDELLSPAAMAELHAAAHEVIDQARRSSGIDASRTRLKTLQGEIERLVDAVVQMGATPALSERLAKAEAEKADLQQRLSEQAAGSDFTADGLVAAYRRRMMRLQEALDATAGRDQARDLLAEVLGFVLLREDEEGAQWLEMEEPAQRMMLSGSTPTDVVAGARFELATFGL